MPFDSPASTGTEDASDVVRGVPNAVWLSYRTDAGTTCRAAGAPALSSRLAIDGRRNDIV